MTNYNAQLTTIDFIKIKKPVEFIQLDFIITKTQQLFTERVLRYLNTRSEEVNEGLISDIYFDKNPKLDYSEYVDDNYESDYYDIDEFVRVPSEDIIRILNRHCEKINSEYTKGLKFHVHYDGSISMQWFYNDKYIDQDYVNTRPGYKTFCAEF